MHFRPAGAEARLSAPARRPQRPVDRPRAVGTPAAACRRQCLLLRWIFARSRATARAAFSCGRLGLLGASPWTTTRSMAWSRATSCRCRPPVTANSTGASPATASRTSPFKSSADARGMATNDFSLPTSLRPAVEPLPPEPNRSFSAGSRSKGQTSPVTASSDRVHGDEGLCGRMRPGMDPKVSDRQELPRPHILRQGEHRLARVGIRHPRQRSDVRFRCWRSPSLTLRHWEAVAGPESGLSPSAPYALAFSRSFPQPQTRGTCRWRLNFFAELLTTAPTGQTSQSRSPRSGRERATTGRAVI